MKVLKLAIVAIIGASISLYAISGPSAQTKEPVREPASPTSGGGGNGGGGGGGKNK